RRKNTQLRPSRPSLGAGWVGLITLWQIETNQIKIQEAGVEACPLLGLPPAATAQSGFTGSS
ncbi:MAG: hypothetical protein ACYC36_08025, partial [Bellilinea sp.]